MCIFAGRQDGRYDVRVSSTYLFARLTGRGTQFLVYSMTVATQTPVAMILPLPVPRDRGDNAVRFLDFKTSADFFRKLEEGMLPPDPPETARAGGIGGGFGGATKAARPRPPLPVIPVGDFLASYVPSPEDFDRLSPDFQLPDFIWEEVPQYQRYGFAIFQIKPNRDQATPIPPMALEFPTATPRSLYFPTRHLHDGQMPAREDFDHALFCQGRGATMSRPWARSRAVARELLPVDRLHGVVEPGLPYFRQELRGNRQNRDTTFWMG